MTIHYHGTPITPTTALYQLAGRHFCVSFAAPSQVKVCHEIGQSVMLDNGAFSLWRAGKPTDWPGFYRWCETWLDYKTTWAVIPDVISGDESANDALIAEWPFGDRGAPVWHLHESIDRFRRLCERWPRVCIGSSGDYSAVDNPRWRQRMDDAMLAICAPGAAPPVWLHMLRGMKMAKRKYPFASVDSTDIARNHHLLHQGAGLMAAVWDSHNCPPRWSGPDPFA